MKLKAAYKIWDKAPHNAMTDLIYFNEQWFCTFREGEGHMSFDGKIRVIASKDTENWDAMALLESPDEDLRDPHFCITPNNELMLTVGIRVENPEDGNRLKSITYFSKDGKTWSEPSRCETGLGSWRWSTQWHKGTAYSFAYGGKDKHGCLYHSKDGKSWQILKNEVYPKEDKTFGNETSMFFKDDTAYCLLRRDRGTYRAMLGTSTPPYTQWKWKNLKTPLGGPVMIDIGREKRFLSVVRLYAWARTSVCWIYPRSGQIKEVLELPSGGDTSYAGLVYKEGIAYISYYSSHEEKTAIYFAKVRV